MTMHVTIALLTSAGIDPDAITETPDRVATITAPDGSRYSLGEDGPDSWTGTRYSADDDIEGTDSWESSQAMVNAVATWWARR